MKIEDYLERIRLRGELRPDYQSLCALQQAHLLTVPFENLDIALGRPITLDLPYIYQKIVRNKRGGFCYELNGLFAWLLERLGFTITYLSASDAQPDGTYGPEFDHLVLLVGCPADPDGRRWLADVGWGDTFHQPLDIASRSLQVEGRRSYRLEVQDGWYWLWELAEGSWEQQYCFTLQPRAYADFADMCHYHQTSAQSLFTQHRLCTLATASGRITLRDDRLILTENGVRQELSVRSGEEFEAILSEKFGIYLAGAKLL